MYTTITRHLKYKVMLLKIQRNYIDNYDDLFSYVH